MPNNIRISKAEILEAAGAQLAKLFYEGGGAKEAPHAASSEETAPRRRAAKRKKKAKATHTPPRTISEQQILDLIRQRGPLRVKELEDITGLTQSAAHKKVATLRTQGAIKEVKEGTIVRYAATRGGSKTARK